MDCSRLAPGQRMRFACLFKVLPGGMLIGLLGLILMGTPTPSKAQTGIFSEFGPICMATGGDVRLSRLAAASRGWTLAEREGLASVDGYTDYYRQGRGADEIGIGQWYDGDSLRESCTISLGDSYEAVQRAITGRLGFEPTLSLDQGEPDTWLFQLDNGRLRPRADIRQWTDIAPALGADSELHVISIEEVSEPGTIPSRNIHYIRYRGINRAEFDTGLSSTFKRFCFDTGGEPVRVRAALAAAGLRRLPGASESYGSPDTLEAVELRSFSRHGATNQACSIEISSGARVVQLAVRKWLGARGVPTDTIREGAWIFTGSPVAPEPLTNRAQRVSERSLIKAVMDHSLFYLVTLTPERITLTRIVRGRP